MNEIVTRHDKKRDVVRSDNEFFMTNDKYCFNVEVSSKLHLQSTYEDELEFWTELEFFVLPKILVT